jgi:hypothetical protein
MPQLLLLSLSSPLDSLLSPSKSLGVRQKDKKKKKKERKENYKKSERKFLQQLVQFTLNHLYQDHLLYFEKVEKVLGKKKT